ncbi:MAG: hypothetical protein CSA65_04445 [Proteobacteria bacterium]|nr:MAG: hypothetical protein CSA65_04445 [Pseudomonadota bacterium]
MARVAHDPLARIRRHLHSLGRRRLLLRMLCDGGVLVAGAAVAFLLLALAAPEQGKGSRSVGLAVGGLGLLFFVVYTLALLRRLRSERELARLVGSRAPRLASDLLSSIELATEAQAESARFSPALYQALVERTWSELALLTPAQVAPIAALRPAAILLGVAALAWSGAATLAPQRIARGAGALLSARSTRLQLATEPLIGDLQLTYHYPAYLRRPPHTVRSSTGQVTAPLGTRIELATTPIRERGRLALVFEPINGANTGANAARIPLERRAHGALGCSLPITASGRYYIEATLVGGARLRDPTTRRIDVELDARPRITLLAPPDGIDVASLQQIELGYVASDDHGLREIQLAYRKVGGETRRLQLWPRPAAAAPLATRSPSSAPATYAGPEAPRRATAKHVWDLASLAIAKGGKVAYWLEAVDGDTVSGPKVGRSQIRHLRAFSAEERHDRTLAQHKQLLEQALRLLAARSLLRSPLRARTPRDPLAEQRGHHRRQGRLADGLRSLEARMREDKLVPSSVLAAFARMQRRLRELLARERKLLASARGATRLTRRAALEATAAAQTRELEDDTLLLANLLEEQKLQQVAEAAAELEANKRELAKLVARYRESKDPALRRQIRRRIAALEKQVKRLLSRLSKLSTTLPDEYLNREAVRRLGLAGKVEKLAELFKTNKLDKLEAALSALDDKLASMRKLLAGNLDSFRDQRMTARERAFGQLMNRLHELENEQRTIAGRTEQVAKSYRQRAAAALAGKLKALLARQVRRLAALQKELAQVGGQRRLGYLQRLLGKAKQSATWLGQALAQRDVAQALAMAKRLAGSLDLLQADLSRPLFSRWLRSPSHMRDKQHVKRAHGLAKEIQRDLEAKLPKPERLLSPAQRARLRALQKEQRALAKRAQALRKKLAKSEAPLGAKMEQGLDQARELMAGASRQLGQSRPQQAKASQQSAAEKLSGLRESLRRSRQPRGGSRRAASRQRVKIPGSDAFKPPKAFREDIMEAMKEKAPKRYRRPVRRYYRELVR